MLGSINFCSSYIAFKILNLHENWKKIYRNRISSYLQTRSIFTLQMYLIYRVTRDQIISY